MAQDDFFSFGDEELEAELSLPDLGDGLQAQAIDLLDPPQVVPAGEPAPRPAANQATRPRGDSKTGSSARRLPSSRPARLLAALALGLLALVLIHVVASVFAGGQGQEKSRLSESAGRSVPTPTAELAARRHAEEIRASRERAAERQRARRQRAQTRRRARRRRQRVAALRHRRNTVRQPSEAPSEVVTPAAEAPAAEIPAPTYVSPSPTPEATSPEGGDGHVHNGSSSSEFGL